MSYSNYGGGEYSTGYGSGSGGGGFMASQGGSQASPGSGSKGTRTNTLRPVTIKQVLEATQSHSQESSIDDYPITHITFVAKIRNITEQSTNITYVVEDGTGVIDVKQWIDAEVGPPEDGAQKLNGQYVRVLGQLKEFNNKKHVGAHSIKAVANYNEVQYHLLEATAIHLQLTRGPPEQFALDSVKAGARGQGQDTTMGGMGGGEGAVMADAGNMPSHDKLPSGASMGARKVYDTIRQQPESNEGVHVQIIATKSGMTGPDVSKAVDELLSAGVAFTTLDDNHVAVMDF